MSTTDPEKPERKKPGPKPERLAIDPEDAEDVLDALLGKTPPEGEDAPQEPAEGDGGDEPERPRK